MFGALSSLSFGLVVYIALVVLSLAV